MKNKFSEVLELIRSDQAQQNYFFQKVSHPEWFIPLKSEGYFDPNNQPAIERHDDKSITIPDWKVLPYLVRISESLSGSEFTFIIEEIVSLIRATAIHKNINPRTCWYFVQMLARLPIAEVPIDIYRLLTHWVRDDEFTHLVGMEICTHLIPSLLQRCSTKDDVEKLELALTSIIEFRVLKHDPEDDFDEAFRFCIDPHWIREAYEKNISRIAELVSDNFLQILKERIRIVLCGKQAAIVLTEEDSTLKIVLEMRKDQTCFDISLNKQNAASFLCEFKANSGISKFIALVRGKLPEKKLDIKLDDKGIEMKARDLYLTLFGRETYDSLYEWHPYTSRHPGDLLILIFKQVLENRIRTNGSITSPFINGLVEESFLLFPKLCLYLVGRFAVANGLFWKLLEGPNGILIFESLYFGDELRGALSSLKELTSNQVHFLEKFIEPGSQIFGEPDENERDLWKLERYEALSHLDYFQKKHQTLKEKTGRDWKLRAAIGPVESRWGYGESALDVQDFIGKSSTEIAAFLSTFKTANRWDGPTVWALGEKLRDAVNQNPSHFVRDLQPFSNTAYYYVYRIVDGYRSAIKEDKIGLHPLFLQFIDQYIRREEFWNDSLPVLKEEVWEPNHAWVVGEFAKAVEDFCKNDKSIIEEKGAKVVEELLLYSLLRLKPKKYDDWSEEDKKNPVQQAINSITGQVIESLTNLALFNTRRHKTGNQSKPALTESESLCRALDSLQAESVAESFTMTGMFLSNLYYLNAEWSKKKIKALEQIIPNHNWQCFIFGYFFTNRFYDVIYKEMLRHYDEALSASGMIKQVMDNLYEHLAVSYLRNLEDMTEKSRFGIWLRQAKSEDLKHLSWFFWSLQRKEHGSDEIVELPKEIRNKIIDYWRWQVNWFKAKKTLSKDDLAVVGSLAKLGIFLDDLNSEGFDFLMFAASSVHVDFDQTYLIEVLNGFCQKTLDRDTAKYIALIFGELLKHSTPDFPKEHIRSIVGTLFSSSETKKLAQEICNVYGSRGNHMLREIHDKFMGGTVAP